MEINFNNLKKSYLKVTLRDKDKTVLNIGSPTKKIYDDFKSAREEDLYPLCTTLMNYNKEHKEFTEAEVEQLLDYEDAKFLIAQYVNFINLIANQKN